MTPLMIILQYLFTRNNRIAQYEKINSEAKSLFIKKNADYGDAFAEYGALGVLIRLNDKIKRVISVSKNNISLVDNESIRDTLIDLNNYSIMALMLLDNENIGN